MSLLLSTSLSTSQLWYREQKKKRGKAFLKERAEIQAKNTKKRIKEHRKYQRNYHREYSLLNKEKVRQYRAKRLKDPIERQKERLRLQKWNKKQRMILSDYYIRHSVLRNKIASRATIEHHRFHILFLRYSKISPKTKPKPKLNIKHYPNGYYSSKLKTAS